MDIETLIDLTKRTFINVGAWRVGDFVTQNKTGAQGVIIGVQMKQKKNKNTIKIKVWLTDGRIQNLKSSSHFTRLFSSDNYEIDVTDERNRTFNIVQRNVQAPSEEEEEKVEVEEKEEKEEEEFRLDITGQTDCFLLGNLKASQPNPTETSSAQGFIDAIESIIPVDRNDWSQEYTIIDEFFADVK